LIFWYFDILIFWYSCFQNTWIDFLCRIPLYHRLWVRLKNQRLDENTYSCHFRMIFVNLSTKFWIIHLFHVNLLIFCFTCGSMMQISWR
jgi:hypothetical protein